MSGETTKTLDQLDAAIRRLRAAAEEVMEKGTGVEAVRRNTKRILASVKMLELNICDLKGILP